MLRVYLAILILVPVASKAGYRQQTRTGAEGPFTYLFDTGTSSPVPLSGEALSKRIGWTTLPEDEVVHKFRGNVVFMNDKLAVALRRGTCGAEVYSRRGDDFKMRGLLTPVAEDPTVRFSSVKIVQNNPSAVAVDATVKTTDGQTFILHYELQMGQTFIKTESLRGVTRLRVQAPCRLAVLPDFFADGSDRCFQGFHLGLAGPEIAEVPLAIVALDVDDDAVS